MARIAIRAWVLLVGLAGIGARADDGVMLREEATGATQVLIEMKAQGESRPELPPGSPKDAPVAKPVPLRIEARLDFLERVVSRDAAGLPKRAARRVVEAATALGEPQGRLLRLRPEVAILIAERREAGVIVYSAGGPLTRWELEMVQVPGDPMALAGLLPTKAVKVGDRWPVSTEAARNLSDYDTIKTNGLEAKLESLDEAEAKIRLGGSVVGSARGGEGAIGFLGLVTFDRKARRMSTIKLTRQETRKEGLVEFGLAVKSTLTIERSACETPKELSDDAIATLPREDDPRREWLLLAAPDAKYTLEHDRDWHLTRENARQIVLKRIEAGELVAQCNLAVGPNAGKGRHQDLEEFRADVKKALGARFTQIVGAGDVDGGPNSGFLYKVAVAGQEGDLGVLWYYYLIASPEGDQLLATFTLDQGSEKRFGNADREILSTLEWKAVAGKK
ncbi:MAG: hypothetical protein JWN86_1940 [Planctomycetota bacterium]|nr:hypothetical protein [Planctomycetota bacterium]